MLFNRTIRRATIGLTLATVVCALAAPQTIAGSNHGRGTARTRTAASRLGSCTMAEPVTRATVGVVVANVLDFCELVSEVLAVNVFRAPSWSHPAGSGITPTRRCLACSAINTHVSGRRSTTRTRHASGSDGSHQAGASTSPRARVRQVRDEDRSAARVCEACQSMPMASKQNAACSTRLWSRRAAPSARSANGSR
jgi:hypothetical protein